MKLLTKEQQSVIERQMNNRARDIDLCLYNALDGSLPRDFVLDGLMLYINSDGGFGSGLYIDNYNPNSSAYQVYEAYRLLGILGFDFNEQSDLFKTIVSKSGNYLYNRNVSKDGLWDPNVKTNNDFAHAMPFTYSIETRALFGVHPSLALYGYTLLFNVETKAYYKKALKGLDSAVAQFLKKDKLTKFEFQSANELIMCLRRRNILPEVIARVEGKVIECARAQISTDFTDISAIHPLDALLYVETNEFDSEIEAELDYIIDSIESHGLWDYKGSWGYNIYAEEDSAKMKWIGAVSVNNYYILKKYGRLE